MFKTFYNILWLALLLCFLPVGGQQTEGNALPFAEMSVIGPQTSIVSPPANYAVAIGQVIGTCILLAKYNTPAAREICTLDLATLRRVRLAGGSF